MEIINLCASYPWNALEVIATNAVHGGIVLGGQITPLDGLNLRYEGMVAEVNGELVGSRQLNSAIPPRRWHGWRTSWLISSWPCTPVISCSAARSFACFEVMPARQ